jgi:hypothetical protein
VLIGEHFPWLIDLVTPLMRRSLYAPDRPKAARNILFEPDEGQHERSGDETPRETSPYATARLHPIVVARAVAVIGALVGLGFSAPRKREA